MEEAPRRVVGEESFLRRESGRLLRAPPGEAAMPWRLSSRNELERELRKVAAASTASIAPTAASVASACGASSTRSAVHWPEFSMVADRAAACSPPALGSSRVISGDLAASRR